MADGKHRVEVEDFDPSNGPSTRVVSFQEGRIGYGMWAERTGRIGPSVEDRYDHDTDELMAKHH